MARSVIPLNKCRRQLEAEVGIGSGGFLREPQVVCTSHGTSPGECDSRI